MAGIYIWAMTLGTAISSVVWGYLNDRRGPRTVVQGACTFATLAPLTAMALAAAASPGIRGTLPDHTALPYLYAVVFLCAGVAFGGMWMGAMNYLFELASHEERPRYIGMLGLLATPGSFFPLLVGWLLTRLPFEPVLALLVACGVVAVSASARMPVPESPAAG
jgi:MFS family permease